MLKNWIAGAQPFFSRVASSRNIPKSASQPFEGLGRVPSLQKNLLQGTVKSLFDVIPCKIPLGQPNRYKSKTWNPMAVNNDAVSTWSLRGWFFVFDWMGAFCLRPEHFSMRLALVGS